MGYPPLFINARQLGWQGSKLNLSWQVRVWLTISTSIVYIIQILCQPLISHRDAGKHGVHRAKEIIIFRVNSLYVLMFRH